MMRALTLTALVAVLGLGSGQPTEASNLTTHFKAGTPEIQSMGTLAFGPDGVLFVGDSKAGAVFAIETGDDVAGDRAERFSISDIEGKLAGLLGTTRDDVMIHDMIVNPVSKNVYLSVSRSRAEWKSPWTLPNDLTDAQILLMVKSDDSIEEVNLKDKRFLKIDLPNPVSEEKMHQWKEGLSLRVDAITDLVFEAGRLYVSGMSAEEFSAALWHIDAPFNNDFSWGTVEIYHGAHGQWETFAPIRTFLPYELNNESHILASYLCTPLVTFRAGDIDGGKHVKGHTVAEFGSGNFPLDLVSANHEGKDFFVMANSMLPLMTFDPESVTEYMAKPGIISETQTYTEGVPYVARAGSGIIELDNFNDKFLVALQRMPNGNLDLVALTIARLAQPGR